MSKQATLPGFDNAISSPESAVGRSRSGSLASIASKDSGLQVYRVSRFRALEADRDTPTSVTFGPLFTPSSPSADLQFLLENRLRAVMDVNGSPEFDLTWSHWDMPAGPPICRLRASARRTGDNGYSGLDTPTTRDWKDGDTSQLSVSANALLGGETCLSPWPTTSVRDLSGSARHGYHNDGRERAAKNPQRKVLTGHPGTTLTDAARLTPWPTPRAEDAESAGMRHGPDTLTARAGQDLTSSPAATGRRGVLNANLSRWMQGYPLAWTLCGTLAYLANKSKPRSPRIRSSRGK